jgi:mono/diheme cytochrome c family protein
MLKTGSSLRLLVIIALVLLFSALAIDVRVPAGAASGPDITQGDYIVNRVGMCSDCHGASLAGGPIRPGPPGVPWATYVPSLRGLPMFAKDADAVSFFETAVKASGEPALPPMPHIRLKPSDADAVIAYLRSLK